MINIRFRCIGIAECCKLIVPLNLSDITTWKQKGRWDLLANVMWMDFPEMKKTLLVLPRQENKRCVYLKDDNQCGIYEDRPEACRNFPFSNFEKNEQIKCCRVYDITDEDRLKEKEMKHKRNVENSVISLMAPIIEAWVREARMKAREMNGLMKDKMKKPYKP